MINPNRFYGYKHWTLEDPPRCFNVGKGVKKRPHSYGSRSHKWHHTVKRLGLRVEVCVGPMSNQQACIWEMQYIPLMGTRSDNHTHNNDADIGCNFTDGGEGTSGHNVSEETRAKHRAYRTSDETRAKLKGRVKSLEERAKLSVSHMGHKVSDETRAKLFAQNIGRKHTNETCEKISRANMGHEVSDETREKLRKRKSPEHCKKLREAAKHRPHITEETRAKLRAYRATDETRIKQQKAALRRHARERLVKEIAS